MKAEHYSSIIERTEKDVITDILSSLEPGEKRTFEDFYQGPWSVFLNGYPEVFSIKRFKNKVKVYTEDDTVKVVKDIEEYRLEDLIAILAEIQTQ